MQGKFQDDKIYYAHGMRVPLAKRAAIFARDRMFGHFMSTMRPGPQTSILDFGASEEATEESNVLERLYPYPQKITCAGIGDGAEIRRAYPSVHYVNITPGEALPFRDGQFDIAYSNAVFEHLGSDAERAKAAAELLRVARRVYITVPNRWFPVEHHTGIPLLHCVPAAFRMALKNTSLSYWADPRNMDFMSRQGMVALLSGRATCASAWCGIAMGPFSSNIAVWTSDTAT